MTTQSAENGSLRAKAANVWARDPHDFYCEPEWTSKRLFESEKFEGNVVDPACGTGRIVRAAIDAGLDARGYDLVKRSAYCLDERDFLDWRWPNGEPVRNIVSNPPFKHCSARADFKFIRLAIERAERKVALLLPATFDCGDKNSRFLETTPLRRKLIITPRPSMPPGAVIEAGIKPGGGTTDFAWFVWLRGYDGKPETGWLRRDDA
ncbi:MAG: hypothetical protein Q8M31_21795 [Beijerinckiaceae bacterium]|nr:hypothetical protein [Beijerinckiaceae bacterium]